MCFPSKNQKLRSAAEDGDLEAVAAALDAGANIESQDAEVRSVVPALDQYEHFVAVPSLTPRAVRPHCTVFGCG